MHPHPPSPHRPWLALTLWGLLLIGLVYGRSLTLPFFFDDFVHLPYVDSVTLGDMWRTAGSLAYYRPLPFVLWKLLYLLFGYHSPLAHHAVNLLCHLLNGLLLAQLAGVLWNTPQRWPRRWLAATLYWLFPFSYQAVPWAGALSQLLVTMLILLALACYWQTQTAVSPRPWTLLSLFFALLAPFAHENGILIGPLLTLTHWTTPGAKFSHGLRPGLLWTLPALLWLPLWWLAPKAVDGQIQINGSEPLRQNLTYFAQGLAYPTTWLGGWLRDQQGWPDMAAAGLLIAAGLLLATLVLWSGNANRRAWLPGLWWLTAVFPATLLLPFDYIINGPRLLTAASVGIAWLWADVILTLTRHPSRWRTSLAVGSLLLLLGQNITFIWARMELHHLLGTAVHQATHLSQEIAPAPLTLINFPSWLAPTQASYALGHEGVQFWPDYAHPNALVATQTGQPATVNLVRHDATRATPPYFYGVSGPPLDWATLLPAAGQIYAASYTPQTITLYPAGAITTAPDENAPVAEFTQEENGRLLTLHRATLTPHANGLLIDLLWQLHAPPTEEITLFVHAIDPSGQLVAQADGDPLAGTYPFAQWQPGQTLHDRRWLPQNSLNLTLLVGVYSRQTGARLTPLSSQTTPDNAIVLQPSPRP